MKNQRIERDKEAQKALRHKELQKQLWETNNFCALIEVSEHLYAKLTDTRSRSDQEVGSVTLENGKVLTSQ